MPNSASHADLESGGGLFPLGSAPLPDSQSQQSARRGNERKIHMNRLVQLKQLTSVFLVALLLACFGFLCAAQAVVPAPDGGYPGGNTAEGQSALLSLTIGGFNTAVGYLSLRSNTKLSFAQEQHKHQLQYGRWRWNTPCQHRARKYGRWCRGPFKH